MDVLSRPKSKSFALKFFSAAISLLLDPSRASISLDRTGHHLLLNLSRSEPVCSPFGCRSDGVRDVAGAQVRWGSSWGPRRWVWKRLDFDGFWLFFIGFYWWLFLFVVLVELKRDCIFFFWFNWMKEVKKTSFWSSSLSLLLSIQSLGTKMTVRS